MAFEPSTPYENRSKPMTAARKRALSDLLDAVVADESTDTINDRIAALEATLDTATTGIVDRVEAVEAAINTAVTGILARLTALEA